MGGLTFHFSQCTLILTRFDNCHHGGGGLTSVQPHNLRTIHGVATSFTSCIKIQIISLSGVLT